MLYVTCYNILFNIIYCNFLRQNQIKKFIETHQLRYSFKNLSGEHSPEHLNPCAADIYIKIYIICIQNSFKIYTKTDLLSTPQQLYSYTAPSHTHPTQPLIPPHTNRHTHDNLLAPSSSESFESDVSEELK